MIDKVIIQGYKDAELTGTPVSTFKLPVNPENLARTFKVQRDETQASGTQQNAQKFKRTENEELKFDFTLDATNTIEGYLYQAKSITEQLDNFLDVVYKMNGEKREPNALKIIWGSEFVFECQMSSLNATYSLFDPTGLPLRAKLSVSFNSYMEAKKRVILEDKKQGALTSVVSKVVGERLADIVQKAYSDPNLFLQIAKINNIVNFRGLKETADLILPPIQKAVNAANQISNATNNVLNTANNTINTANNALNTANNAINTANNALNTANSAINTAKKAGNTIKKLF